MFILFSFTVAFCNYCNVYALRIYTSWSTCCIQLY